MILSVMFRGLRISLISVSTSQHQKTDQVRVASLKIVAFKLKNYGSLSLSVDSNHSITDRIEFSNTLIELFSMLYTLEV